MYNLYNLIILVVIMYVRIEYKGKAYYSYVFAHFEFDYMPHYIVYDPIDDKFDIVPYFSEKCYGNRQVGFMNESEKDFIHKDELELNMGLVKKVAGYCWLIDNTDLIKNIEAGKLIDEEYVIIAKKMNSTINPDAWNEVLTKEDAEDMMYHVGGFHDWYLVNLEAKSDPYDCSNSSKIQLRFTSQAAFDTLLEFEGGYIKYNFCPANRIYLSSIVFNDDFIYWVDGEEDLEFKDIKDYNYILGNKLRWKFILKEDHDW